jgi:hypothetical protein
MPDINVVFVTPAKERVKKCLKHRHSGAWAQREPGTQEHTPVKAMRGTVSMGSGLALRAIPE